MGKFKTALRDFTTVCKVVPNDAQAKLKRKECEKIVRRMLFEEAIAGDDEKSIFEAVEIETMGKRYNINCTESPKYFNFF